MEIELRGGREQAERISTYASRAVLGFAAVILLDLLGVALLVLRAF